MPATKICILAKSRHEAVKWAKSQGLKPNRYVFPFTADRVRGVHFAKIIVLPSFARVRNRHAILRALKNTESRRFVKNKPEWVDVSYDNGGALFQETTEMLNTGPAEVVIPNDETPPIPDGELPGQTDIFQQIQEHESSAAGDAANEGTPSKTDSQVSHDEAPSSVDDDPEPAAEAAPPKKRGRPKKRAEPPKDDPYADFANILDD